MYSEKLRQAKIAAAEVDSTQIFNELDNFCIGDDLIGVPCSVAASLFREYCNENEKMILVSYTTFGIAVCKKFNLETKMARVDGKLMRVYRRR